MSSPGNLADVHAPETDVEAPWLDRRRRLPQTVSHMPVRGIQGEHIRPAGCSPTR
ncbi:hypothetical protein I546_5338 [Mycobacterium kansasii 732]|nr:hypothetical protein I546_5338 [Mycobacterium kansasii 732]